ncbi:MAG TPA: alginate lyase family protein [Chryseolinea sp.]|nr:alginate lyase family protein [Chryseolinea sp.]
MKATKLFFLFLITLSSGHAIAQSPAVFLMNPARLVEVKKKLQQHDKAIVQLVAGIQKAADAKLEMKPVSVMDKEFTPASGSKHDYMSQAPYFWYDSTKPNGLPYMRRDGVRNPEINKITDRGLIGDLESATRLLSLAWYFTGDEKYAAKSADLLRYWFLDNDTRMNPNLDYAQAIPGINTGRGIGIIESRALTGIADAIGLLQGSTHWPAKDGKAMQEWYSKYLDWMLTSKNGKEEHAAKNNHGTWFYMQVIDFALFINDNGKAKALAEESKKLIDNQITGEGKMPLELERTNGLGYSTFNLDAWFELATVAERAGSDIWQYKNGAGAGLFTALKWLQPYAMGEKTWPYQQISKYNTHEFYPLLLRAAKKNNDPSFLQDAGKLRGNEKDQMVELFYGE